MDDYETIKADFKNGQLSFIDAIERLQAIGFDPQKAELRVFEWDQNEEYD